MKNCVLMLALAACSGSNQAQLDDGSVADCADCTCGEGIGECDAAVPLEPNVIINEVESSGGSPGDWVELHNAGTAPGDVGGWRFLDNDDAHAAYVIPAGTTIAAGGYLVLDEADFGFGIGAADSVRLFDAASTPVDSYSWTAHAETTYGRCANGTGAFATTIAPTKGSDNSCSGGSATVAPWPGQNTVTTVDGTNVFATNLSGVFHDGTALWAARNGPSTLFRLAWNGSLWAPSNTWTLRYPNNSGTPDAEDVAMAELGGIVYIVTERDNDNAGTSRPSILRFDSSSSTTTLVATHEWNLVADLPTIGANLGLEAITWIPDSFLVANAFFDAAAGATYNPATYPDHGTGLFFVGLEANGTIYAYALDHTGGGFTRVATLVSGDPSSKALSFDRETGYLWQHCGMPCAGESRVFVVDTTAASSTYGRFQLRKRFARATTLSDIANEGFAISPEAQCVNNFKPVYWSDDSNTDSHALRRDSIPCGPFITP